MLSDRRPAVGWNEEAPPTGGVRGRGRSGVAIQGLRLLAERGAQKGAAKLVTRRPRPNRG